MEIYVQKERLISREKLIIIATIAIAGMFLAIPDSPKPSTETHTHHNKVDLRKAQGEFVKRFARLAIEEGKLWNIPPSIVLGVGATNSQGFVDARHHNLFRLKPDTNWDGHVITFANQDGSEYTLKKYNTPLESFRDFSITVNELIKAKGITNRNDLTTEQWAKILQEADICEVESVIAVIQMYDIGRLDTLSL
jgi:flagellum-specific peptidoglycan hydrolase FlgJ